MGPREGPGRRPYSTRASTLVAGPAGFFPVAPELIATTAQDKDPLDALLDLAVDEKLNTGFSLGGIKQTAPEPGRAAARGGGQAGKQVAATVSRCWAGVPSANSRYFARFK